jgi:hypothetical protein
MSSISTMTTFGAPAGAFTSNRGGAVTFRASISVKVGRAGSAIGRTVRSIDAVPAGDGAGGAGFGPEHAVAVSKTAAAAAAATVVGLIEVLLNDGSSPTDAEILPTSSCRRQPAHRAAVYCASFWSLLLVMRTWMLGSVVKVVEK